MNKPYIICHMASTIDGRIISANWGKKEQAVQFSALYEECHETYQSQAWMVGRITSEKDFSKADGTAGNPAVFEASKYLHKNPAALLSLVEVQKLEHDVLWLKNKVRRN